MVGSVGFFLPVMIEQLERLLHMVDSQHDAVAINPAAFCRDRIRPAAVGH
jgi:hypothetical protein